MHTIRDKHYKLDQGKLSAAREILGAKTETETAVEMLGDYENGRITFTVPQR